MLIRAWARAFEQRCLRPLGRALRPGGRRRGAAGNRIDALERRVEELEGLVRELTGLVYLGLDDPQPAVGRQLDQPPGAGVGEDDAAAREAA
jgi:hypothetical protein